MTAVFCDWITLYQQHLKGCPRFDAGMVLSVDSDGTLEWHTARGVSVKGSHSTQVLVSSDGHRVRLSGNVGRFGRADNVFGYSVAQCVDRANAIVRGLGLPEFTTGDTVVTRLRHSVGPESLRVAGTLGAVVTRLDLTRNYVTGSQSSAGDYLNWLEGQQPGRLKACSYGEHTTVTWGFGSKYASAKVYNKYVEVIRHGGNDFQLVELLHNEGVVRGEVTLKSRYLRQHNLQDLSSALKTDWDAIFMKQLGDRLAPSAQVPDEHDMPSPYLGTFLAWRDGVDVAARMSRSAFYRHRRYLLMYGHDIARASSVRRLPIKVREIRLRPLVAPRWYLMPEALDVSFESDVEKATG